MFQHILIPLDGSPRAEQAIPVAARLAHATGGDILALKVLTPPTGYVEHAETQVQAVQEVIEADQAEANAYLGTLGAKHNLLDVQVKPLVMLGELIGSIVSAIETYQADLVIIGSHGYTGLRRSLTGSTVEEIAHASPVPVLVLREGRPLSTRLHPDDASLVRILVPLDGTGEAQIAVEPAAQIALALSTPARAALHLLRVVILPDSDPSSQADREEIMQEAQRYLSEIVERARKQTTSNRRISSQLRLTGSVTVDDDIAAGIARIAESGEDTEGASLLGGCDIIAMATHGYGNAHPAKIGTASGITERVLMATRLPLLFVQSADVPNKRQPARITISMI